VSSLPPSVRIHFPASRRGSSLPVSDFLLPPASFSLVSILSCAHLIFHVGFPTREQARLRQSALARFSSPESPTWIFYSKLDCLVSDTADPRFLFCLFSLKRAAPARFTLGFDFSFKRRPAPFRFSRSRFFPALLVWVLLVRAA
jgi:hypothetical protein